MVLGGVFAHGQCPQGCFVGIAAPRALLAQISARRVPKPAESFVDVTRLELEHQ
jgi:hypothetical protein